MKSGSIKTSISIKDRICAILRYIALNKWLYFMFVPGMIIFFIFNYIPMYGVILAFKEFNIRLGIIRSPWIGLKHFSKLFNDQKFADVFKNTVIISLLKIAAGIPFAPGLAILLSEIRAIKFKRAIQTMSYLPYFISWVVVYGMFYSFLSIDGIVNSILSGWGFEPVSFLTRPELFRTIIVAADIWKNFGWGSIIYLAAISGIDPTQYEAAIIDGASRIQKIAYITIPALKGALFTVLILMLGGIMSAGFDQIFVFYNEAVYSTGDIIDTYVYRIGLIAGKFEMATAFGLFKSAIGFALLAGANYLSRKYNEVGLY